MHHADNFDTGVDAGSHDTALKRAEPGRPGRGRVRSLAPRGLAGLLAALVALPLQAQAQTASTDATLSGLEILGAPDGETIALIPVFDAATGAYTAMVANRIDAVTLTATKSDNTATVAITSDDNTNTPDEAVLSLTVLANTLTVTVTVTASDTTTTQTYTITVARAAAHPAPTDCPADTAWCATLGVGFADVSPNNFIKTEIWGYQRDASYGDLSPVTFFHGGTSYTVAFLYRLNSTAGGITVGDQLNLDVGRLDLPDGTVLQLGSRTFTVDTVSDTGTPGLEEWDLQANPLDWTAEQHVTASLKFPPPPAPVTGVTGVTVAAGDMELVVEWTAVDTATGYTVQWKTDGEDYNTDDRQATVTSGSTTSYTISGLTNDTEYTVRVIATRTGANDGDPSAEVTGKPAPPTKAGVTVSKPALTVTDENTTVGRYTVVLDTQPTADVTVTSAVPADTTVTPSLTTLPFTTATWNVAQTVTVTAYTDADTANETVSLTHSATSTDTDYDGITIAGVTVTVTDNDTTLEVTVTPGDAQLVVEWTAVDTATVYTVQWKSDSGATRVYVDHRRWSSSQDTRWENGRSATRVQYAECDDRHGPPSFLRRRSMKQRWLGPWRASFDSCTNASEPEADSHAAAGALAVACEAAPHEHVRPGAHGDPAGDAALSLKGSDAEANRDAVIGIIRLRQVRQRHRHRHTRLGYCRALVEPVEPAVDAAQPASDGVEAHGMNRQPLRVLHDVLLVRGGQSSVVANLETVLTDGRRVPADAGAVRVDVGAVLPDGGAVHPDVSRVPLDAGAVRVDVGAILPDGGAVRVDGGAVLPDGGAVHPDVTRVPLCAAVNVDDRLPLHPGREPDQADLRVVRLNVSRVPLDAGAVRVDVGAVVLHDVGAILPDGVAVRLDVIRVVEDLIPRVLELLVQCLFYRHEGQARRLVHAWEILIRGDGDDFIVPGRRLEVPCLRGACPKAGDDDDGDGVELTHDAISFVAPTGSGHWGIARDNCSYRELS